MKTYTAEQQEIIARITAHNDSIDNFINVTLRNHFGKDTVNASEWFEAQRLINAQNFYEKGIAILREARSHGIHVLINCQSNKLV